MPAGNDNDSALNWAGSGATKPLNSNARFDSDAVAIDTGARLASLQVTLDNQGSPAAGDYVDLWIKWSVDGDTYDTDEHAMWLARMDTYGANDPGEDPCTKTFALYVMGKQAFKLTSKANQGATRTINISAKYNEFRD